MRKLIVLGVAGAAVAVTAIAVTAGTEVHTLDPGKLPPVVECLDENGNVAAMVLNPIFEVPSDEDTATGC